MLQPYFIGLKIIIFCFKITVLKDLLLRNFYNYHIITKNRKILATWKFNFNWQTTIFVKFKDKLGKSTCSIDDRFVLIIHENFTNQYDNRWMIQLGKELANVANKKSSGENIQSIKTLENS